MKKIGLVTVTYVNNYGSHLQSFALQEVLKKIGCNPEIINIGSVKREIGKKRLLYVLSRLFHFNEIMAYLPILKRKIALKIDKKYYKIYSNRIVQFKKFAEEKYLISSKVNGFKQLSEQCENTYDSVIVGSDQNWRPANIAGGFYTLEFVPNSINKIAYATSFGIDHVIKKQREKVKRFLGRINHLSVREESGRKIISNLLNKDVPVVVDPTLLLSVEDWDNYIGKSPLINGDYIFCYFLGTNKKHWNFVKRLKEICRLKIVGLPFGEQYSSGATLYIDEIPQNIGPFEFVNLIKYAKYICTDSFHGCAFSLNYEKNVFAFYKFAKNGGMSSNGRIDSLFSWTGLTNRILSGNENIESWMLENIDYSIVREKIEKKREMSMQYLTTALEV